MHSWARMADCQWSRGAVSLRKLADGRDLLIALVFRYREEDFHQVFHVFLRIERLFWHRAEMLLWMGVLWREVGSVLRGLDDPWACLASLLACSFGGKLEWPGVVFESLVWSGY